MTEPRHTLGSMVPVPVEQPPAGARTPANRLDNVQKSFLPQSVVLEEAGTPRLIRAMMLSVSALVVALIGWSAVARVDEVAVGVGEIVPTGRVLVVQHLEGGIISGILVHDGDHVAKGQVLVKLDPAAALAELDQTRARIAALELQADRLQAFVDGKESEKRWATNIAGRYTSLAGEQRAILALQEAARISQRNVIETQIRQKEAELAGLRRQRASLERQVEIVGEGYRMREHLYRKGATSKVDYLEVKRDYERTTGDLGTTTENIRQVEQELAEAKVRLTELDARLRSEALIRRGDVTAELAQLREKRVELQDRVDRLDIRAGADGIVKGLAVNTIGGVVAPGQVLMEIVPGDRALVVEARISTRDVGHVVVGQSAHIKVDTYDFARYGALSGELSKISATTFLDDQGRPYYTGTITLSRDYLGGGDRRFPVSPGMTVQAEVITGSKSILQYLLKPIYTTVSQAFHER